MKKMLMLAAVALSVAAAAGFYVLRARTTQGQGHRGFTLHSVMTDCYRDGTITQKDVVCYVRADSSTHMVYTQGGQKVLEFAQVNGRGHFTVDGRNKQLVRNTLVSSVRHPDHDTARDLRVNPNFNRVERVGEYEAYVLRFTDPNTGKTAAEFYSVPGMQGIYVKMVDYDADGRISMKQEPVSVVWGEPTPQEILPPDYPEVVRPPKRAQQQ